MFPLRPGAKIPLPGSHGMLDASAAASVVDRMRWEVDGEEANLGLATGNGLAVLDVDCKKGKDGFEALRAAGLPKERLLALRTFRVDTPSGGAHFYFRSQSQVATRADVLGKGSGVDVRGEGGYAVIPPSGIGGKFYGWSGGNATDADGLIPVSAKLPLWEETVAPFLPKLEAPVARPAPVPPASGPEADAIVERARAYLAKCQPSIEGNGGDKNAFRVTLDLVNGFLLDDETVLSLLMGEWNARCLPPWSEKELRHKIKCARQRGPKAGKAPGWLRNAKL